MVFFDYVKDEALILYNSTISIKELVVFLHKNKHITTLSLKSCQIGDEDVKELAELSNLTSLNLSGNNIGARGAEALANGNLINLTSLDLSGNGTKVSDNDDFVDFSSHNVSNRTENGEEVLARLRHRAEIMKKSQEISNVQASVQSNESQQMNAENDVTKNDGIAASVSSDDKRKQDSIQFAECAEQIDDRQVSLNQNNSQLTGDQQEQLGSEGEELVADEVNNPAILSTANNSNPNKGIETSTLGQDNNTQGNNDDSKDYNQLFELLSTIEGVSGVDESNVTETIQKELKEKNLGMYQKWQGNQFDINYTFASQSTLLHIAAGGGLVKVIKLLITKGADVNKTGRYGWSTLRYWKWLY